MRYFLAAGLLAIAACDAGSSPAPDAAKADPSGWSIATGADMNEFFECLERADVALVAAHRGGPAPGFPENAIETFENTLSYAPAFIEIDVATSSDGVPYLLHDDTLDRTTTGEGPANSLSWAAIAKLRLKDPHGRTTAFRPPSFAEALEWANGRTVLEIDFKRSTRYEDVVAEIDRQQAEDRVVLIAYTMAQARRLHGLVPNAMISLSVSTQTELNRAVAAGVPAERMLGFTGINDPNPRLFSVLNNQDIEVIFGTLGGGDSIDDQVAASGSDHFYTKLAAMGVDIIATDRPREAHAALDAAGRGAKHDTCGIRKP